MGQPLTDSSLNEFAPDGTQLVFAISPFGNSETRAERLARWEKIGHYDPNCPSCKAITDHPKLDPFQPSHNPNRFCRSGGRPHCTCPACWG